LASKLKGLGEGGKEAAQVVLNVVAPTVGSNRDVLDALMRLKGDEELKPTDAQVKTQSPCHVMFHLCDWRFTLKPSSLPLSQTTVRM
jgi:hypothetical protein